MAATKVVGIIDSLAPELLSTSELLTTDRVMAALRTANSITRVMNSTPGRAATKGAVNSAQFNQRPIVYQQIPTGPDCR
jgi:hypothetical protein